MIGASMIGFMILALFTFDTVFVIDPSQRPTMLGIWLQLMAAIAVLIAVNLAVHVADFSHGAREQVVFWSLAMMAGLAAASIYFDDTPHFAYGAMCFVMMPLASNTLVGLQFYRAVVISVLATSFLALVLTLKVQVDARLIFTDLALVISTSAMTLWGNWRTERSERATFLYLMRERLMVEKSRAENAELLEMSVVDQLTGIANRRAFEERFAALAARCSDEGVPLGLSMIDIDHFKRFNDHYGHIEGDRCLRAVAQALAGHLRGPDDFVARLGGEEFVILTPRLEREDAPRVLERLRRGVEYLGVPHAGIRGEASDVVTVSIGCCVADPREGGDPRRCMALADRALYGAKNSGRNRWCLADTIVATAPERVPEAAQ